MNSLVVEVCDLFTQSGATISECGQYRYSLHRTWSDAPPACFIALNPSTADASNDDPTIRRMIRFSMGWGCGGLLVVNLFAFRATDPRALATVTDPVGPANDTAILEAARRSGRVVASWGAHKLAVKRGQHVMAMLAQGGVRELMCLGTTQWGCPRHPLYVAASTPLTTFYAEAAGGAT